MVRRLRVINEVKKCHEGRWRCMVCGAELKDSSDPAWRWNGKIWEHNHGYPLGYFPAVRIIDEVVK